MLSGLGFHAINYLEATSRCLEDLYSVRKEIFADRLNWKVSVSEQLEFDEYDSPQTTYLIGHWEGIPLAGLRLINTLNPYMVEGPFRSFFNAELPKDVLMAESSRFFVDTMRVRHLGLTGLPLTQMLLFAMHNHATTTGLTSIITVVSKAMSRIVHTAGWHYSVLATGEAAPGETVLLLQMPVTPENHQRLLAAIALKYPPCDELLSWPLRLSRKDTARQSIAERAA